MTSVGTSVRGIPTDSRNFVTVSSIYYLGGINALNATTGALTQAVWASGGAGTVINSATNTKYGSTINAPGARLKDMGRTYLSSNRVFRKVQLVVASNTASTFGVEGKTGTVPVEDFLTGYIEVGWEGAAAQPAPVARTM